MFAAYSPRIGEHTLAYSPRILRILAYSRISAAYPYWLAYPAYFAAYPAYSPRRLAYSPRRLACSPRTRVQVQLYMSPCVRVCKANHVATHLQNRRLICAAHESAD